MPRANQPLHPPEASHHALRTSPSGPTAKTSRCSVTLVRAATWLPGFAVPPEMLNHAAQPVVSCHHVLWTRLSVPTTNRSMWLEYRTTAVTGDPADAEPPEIWNQPLAQPSRASHHVDMILPSDAVVNRSRWSG